MNNEYLQPHNPTSYTNPTQNELRFALSTSMSQKHMGDPQPVSYQWIRQSFINGVRVSNSQPVFIDTKYHDDYLHRQFAIDDPFYTNCVPFDGNSLPVEIVTPQKISNESSDNIMAVLTNANFRKGNLALIEPYLPQMGSIVAHHVRKGNPIEIVLPTLPFKDQNPLNTTHSSTSEVDLGEYLFFSQLRNLCASVKNVYPPGAHISILTDGTVYQDMFAYGNEEDIQQYRVNNWRIKEELGLHNTVDIIDMDWLVNREDEFLETQKQITEMLEVLTFIDENTANAMNHLQKGIMWNLPFRSFNYNFDEVALLMNDPAKNLPEIIKEVAGITAIQYAAFLLTMNYLDVIHNNFPISLRATVHPKNAAQLPLHLVNNHSIIFPYNGVPVVSEKKLQATNNIRRSTRILRFHEALQKENLTEVHNENTSGTFYYLSD